MFKPESIQQGKWIWCEMLVWQGVPKWRRKPFKASINSVILKLFEPTARATVTASHSHSHSYSHSHIHHHGHGHSHEPCTQGGEKQNKKSSCLILIGTKPTTINAEVAFVSPISVCAGDSETHKRVWDSSICRRCVKVQEGYNIFGSAFIQWKH